MRMHIFDFMGQLVDNFAHPRQIRRLDTGRAVDSRTARDLRGLSESTLRDIGFTSY
jgi:uncharacterized protein YjiS (DUF1127 family)